MMRWKDVQAVDLLWNLLVGLTVLFTVGKLVGYLDWPWWAVLSPFVVPLSVVWIVFMALFVFWFCVTFYYRLNHYLKDKK